MSVAEKEIREMIALRRAMEMQQKLKQSISDEQNKQMEGFWKNHSQYRGLSSEAMDTLSKAPVPVVLAPPVLTPLTPKPTTPIVQSPDIASMLEDYKTKYGAEKWYKPPETKDGKTEMPFPSHAAAAIFAQEQASKNKSFVVLDKETNSVMAYSNGDGKMRKVDGQEFKATDELKPSSIKFDTFKMPPKTKKEEPKKEEESEPSPGPHL